MMSMMSPFSLLYMKITTSVTKDSHQDHVMCYFFTLNYFFLIHALSSFARKLIVDVAVIPRKLDHRPLFNDIYCKTILE